MADSAKDKSGEIFSGGGKQSAYQEAMQAPEEELQSAEQPYQQSEQINPEAVQPPTDVSGSEEGLPPSPFVEDKRKKLLFFAIFIIFIFLLFFFFINLFIL